MKTMGVQRLIIVGNKEYDQSRIATLAVHAADIYEQHRRFATLKEALAESVLTVGATRRRGKNRKYFALSPEQLAEKINQTGSGEIAIVFGREADGLSDEELHQCHLSVAIPTSDLFPSLNLAQAVQIITYSLFRHLSPTLGYEPIREKRVREVAHTAVSSLEALRFYNQHDQADLERFFRDIFARAALSEKEAQRLSKTFIKIGRLGAQQKEK